MLSVIKEGDTIPAKAAEAFGPCRWLISLDYDGTLRSADLNEPNPVDPGFFGLMTRLRMQGVRWGINTGRPLPYLMEEYLQIAPFMPDFVCTCERYIYMADETRLLRPELEHNTMAETATQELRARLAPEFQAFMLALRHRYPMLHWVFAKDDPLSIEAEDSGTMDDMLPFLEPFMDRWGADIVQQRAGRYMRLSDARYHKGSALAHVAAKWNVPADHVVMVGDGHNDLDMFRSFPQGVCAAPCTAHAEVKEYLQANGGYISPHIGVMEPLMYWRKRILSR